MQMTTELRFCLSHRSTVWKVSWEGTPHALAPSTKLLMFSMHLKAMVEVWIFLICPGFRALITLWRKTRAMRRRAGPEVLREEEARKRGGRMRIY